MSVRSRLSISIGALALAATASSAGRAYADVASCIAANDEGIALRKAGKLRDALQKMAACADAACPAEVKAECTQRVLEVKEAIPTIMFIVKDPAGNDLGGVTVKMDGVPVQGALEGRGTPLDPGQHAFRFEAPGRMPLERTFVLRVGEKDRRENLVLLVPEKPRWWTTQRALAATSLGLGVAGLVTGGVFTAFAASAKSREGSDCSATSCLKQPQAVEDYNTAVKNATGATVGFVAGGVLAAAGVVLFATARTPTAAPSQVGVRFSPLLTTTGGGVVVGGSF